MSDASSSNDVDSKDDLGLTQFSPEVLEFMLAIVRAKSAKHSKHPPSPQV